MREIANWKSKWDIARDIAVYFLPILGFLLGGLFTYLGIRSRLQKWAEEQVTLKASEKLGVDWTIVKQLVDDKRRDDAIKSKRLAIVNKKTGRRQDLVTTLEKYGFKNPSPQFFNLTDFATKFDHNQFDLIIIDNYDSQLTETDIRRIIAAHQFPYVLFTVEQTSKAFFDEFKGKVKFAQIQQNIPEYIAQSF